MVNSRHRIAIAPIKKTRWSLVSWKAIALPLLIAAAGGAESPVAAQCIFPGPETQGVLLTIPANSPPNVGSSIVTLNNYSEAAPLNVVTVSVVQFSVQPGSPVTILGLTQPTLSNPTTGWAGDSFVTYSVGAGLVPGCYTANGSYTYTALDESLQSQTIGPIPYQFLLAVTSSSGVQLIDPVPNLLSGNAVMNSSQLQGMLTQGRTVSGISADGVTQLVIRIDTNSPGHQFSITLLDDQGLSGSNILPNEDGGLGVPGGTSFSSGQVTVTAGNADSNGMGHAFAAYLAPADFARQTSSGAYKSGTCNGSTLTDNQLACRAVSLQIQDITSNIALPTTQITILRPPVFLIHGLWSSWEAWNAFSPLVTGKSTVDGRFHVERVNYKWTIGSSINSSTPQYPNGTTSAQANSMGVNYVAPFVLEQIKTRVDKFRTGSNPMRLPIASVQVDVIAHSMGGLVTRTLPITTGFFSNTFGQGLIHKVISVDVPHLGSPLAALMVDSSSGCTQALLAKSNFFSFTSVTFTNAPNTQISGAMGDFVNSPLSPALSAIARAGTHPLPTALIAGVYTNFASLDCTMNQVGAGQVPCSAQYIRNKCVPQGDVVAQHLNGTSWPQIFGSAGNNDNDAVVSQISQLNGLVITSGTNGFIYSGLLHSPGLIGLSFAPPTVLDSSTAPNPVADQVITLLNTFYTKPAYQALNP
jgi:pimeloyl-ACP methyl ester carboxylesterase